MADGARLPVCAVVGIGPGNGEAFARRFAADGFAVALMARRAELTMKLAAELKDARAYACDVADEPSVEAAFAGMRSDLGDADVVIFNAGSGVWGNVEEVKAEHLERAWRINTLGLFLAARQTIPAMRQKGRSRFTDRADDFFIAPDGVAAIAADLVKQDRSAWSFEVEARPFKEKW
jgi:NAD(P)-dependent dehydrogenase (short-subunit alcohol dehydrogenase family)